MCRLFLPCSTDPRQEGALAGAFLSLFDFLKAKADLVRRAVPADLDRQRAQETGILCESDHEVAVAMLSRPLTRLRGFAYGKVDFPMGAWCQGFDFP